MKGTAVDIRRPSVALPLHGNLGCLGDDERSPRHYPMQGNATPYANGLEQLSRAAAMAGAIASMSTGMSFQLFQNRFGRCL